jgi:hypothetical protein
MITIHHLDGRDQRPAGSAAESNRRARCAGRRGSIDDSHRTPWALEELGISGVSCRVLR